VDAYHPVDAGGVLMPTHADAHTIATDNRAAATNRNSDENSASAADDTASHPDGVGFG